MVGAQAQARHLIFAQQAAGEHDDPHGREGRAQVRDAGQRVAIGKHGVQHEDVRRGGQQQTIQLRQGTGGENGAVHA
ncbi:hypothetical protein D9M68_836840 [compost metagenome]